MQWPFREGLLGNSQMQSDTFKKFREWLTQKYSTGCPSEEEWEVQNNGGIHDHNNGGYLYDANGEGNEGIYSHTTQKCTHLEVKECRS